MWSRVVRFFKGNGIGKKDLEAWKGEIQEDLDGIRKILRRQGLFSEGFKREALALLDERGLKDAEPLLQLAESFFYFESSLLEEPGLTEGQDEAAKIV